MQSVIISKDAIFDLSNSRKECLRGIRTNIQFSGSDIKTILITSVTPDDGKSSVSFDLARSFAEANKRVVLIDTDIRKSVLVSRHKAKTLDGSKIVGLSHYLSGQEKLENIFYGTNITDLYIMYAGHSVPNPTELLDSRAFQSLVAALREKFDYVIIDTAPITAAIDSSLIAKHCDGAVVVMEPEKNSTNEILHAKKQLEASGVRILGVILNKVKMKKNNYYGKYYGSYYGHYYGSYYGNYGNEQEKKK